MQLQPDTTSKNVCLISSLPPHSNVSAKRMHRQWAIKYVLQHPAARPALLYLDDRLPCADDPDVEYTYFTDEVLATGRIQTHQLFSPNLKISVVEDLKQRGLVNVDHCCACLFIQRYASLLRDMCGGVVLAFLDVWGGYQTGARPLLEMSLSLRLLNPSGCMVTFAASDRHARAQGQTSVATYAKVQCDAQRICDTVGAQMRIQELPAGMPVNYQTMQVYGWQTGLFEKVCFREPCHQITHKVREQTEAILQRDSNKVYYTSHPSVKVNRSSKTRLMFLSMISYGRKYVSLRKRQK